MSDPIALVLLRRWCRLAQLALGAAREEIDALNVFPVPDGDTGTNVYLTFEAAAAAVDAAGDDLPRALAALGEGALLSARGNSGVILSQLLRAIGTHLATALPPGDGADVGRCLAESFTLAADAAYTAVAEPVEGTMLTVARAVADAATTAARGSADVAEVITVAAEAGRQALARTPDQLDVLRLAGVVDAGGRALCVLLDAAETAATGRRHSSADMIRWRRGTPLPLVVEPSPGYPGSVGPAYEVMYLLDADDERVDVLRETLAPLGDSLVVVGGSGLWNVHVHVDDVGAAVEAGVVAGVPRRIRVTNLAEQPVRRSAGGQPSPLGSRGLVALAAGPGLEELFVAAGATVIASAPGRRSATREILDAIRRTECAEVIVLPNDSDSLIVAEAAAQAARDSGLRVSVVPTRAQVQGLAAIAVHDPGRRFEDDVVTMTAAAGQTRHGAVTIAIRDAITMAGPCRAGDALGVIDGDFAVVGKELDAVAIEVVSRLLAAGGELVTLVTGRDADATLARSVAERAKRDHPEVDAVVYDGRQPRYPLLLAVE